MFCTSSSSSSMIRLTLVCSCIWHKLSLCKCILSLNFTRRVCWFFYHRMHLRCVLYLPWTKNKRLRETLQYRVRSLMDGLIIGLIFKCAKLDSFHFIHHLEKLRETFSPQIFGGSFRCYISYGNMYLHKYVNHGKCSVSLHTMLVLLLSLYTVLEHCCIVVQIHEDCYRRWNFYTVWCHFVF